jgi:type II secretion system protein C
MQNLKYHLINISSMLLFSYITAITINQIVKHYISPVYVKNISKSASHKIKNVKPGINSFDIITEAGFFKIPTNEEVSTTMQTQKKESSAINQLTLQGTITGPASIARAIIKKRGEKTPGTFALIKISDEINNDVYGNKLIRIDLFKVYLIVDGEKTVLEIFKKGEKKNKKNLKNSSKRKSGNKIKKNISRSWIKQKVFNNLDNAMKGIVAGPNRVNGKVDGFILKKVKRYNILFKFGIRSGDIIKRINGKALNSTNKLYKLYETLKSESKINIDIERKGNPMSFDFNIQD